MENAELNPDTTKLIGVPSLSRTVLITSSWVLTSVILTQIYGYYQKVKLDIQDISLTLLWCKSFSLQVFVIIWNIAFFLIVFNTIAALILVPKKTLMNYIIRFNTSTFLNSDVSNTYVQRYIFRYQTIPVFLTIFSWGFGSNTCKLLRNSGVYPDFQFTLILIHNIPQCSKQECKLRIVNFLLDMGRNVYQSDLL